MDEPRSRNPLSSRLIIGLIIVAIGTILLLGNLGWLDARHLLRSLWPLALVAAGVSMLRNPDKGRNQPWAWVFITVGIWIFLDRVGWVSFNVWQLIMPSILLVVGGTLVWRAMQDQSAEKQEHSVRRIALPGEEPSEFVRSFAFMSYCDLHPVLYPFRGGDVSAVMGGVKLDLRDTKMYGDQATLDVFAFWGGIEILVPPDWIVSSKVTPIIGGFVDSRRPSTVVPTKTLLITGFNLMSGVEVKN
jgi:predicted membrane protein